MIPRSIRLPRSLLAGALLTVAGLAMPAQVRADLVTPVAEATNTSGATLGSDVYGIPGGTSGTGYYAGLISFTLNNTTAFNGYCLTPLNAITAGQSYSATPVSYPGGSSSNFTNPQEVLYLASQFVTNQNTLAQTAAALAIWKLASYSNTAFDPSTFTYTDTNGNALSQSDINTIVADYNADLTDANGKTASGVIEDAGANTGTYGQSVTGPGTGGPPAPEPASVMLLGIGFVGLGGFRMWKRGRAV